MEYKPVAAVSLVVGQRYYIIPKSRLVSNKLVTIVHSKPPYNKIDPKPVPAAKKNTILLLSAVFDRADTSSPPFYGVFMFSNFLNKDNEKVKDSRKSTEEYVYYSFTATPVPSVMGASVTNEEARATIGELAENVLPASMRPAAAAADPEAGAGAGSESVSVSVVPEIRSAMTPAVRKTTDELITTLRLGESRVSVSDILKRKNTPQLENLENRLLYRNFAIQILPTNYPIPPLQYYGVQTVNVYSPYGAIELLIESRHIFADQKDRYIREMVLKGADPSKALVTAILMNDLRSLNTLLDLGADPNYVSEYKSTDGTQRFLTSPLLTAIPARMPDYGHSLAHIRPVLETLTQHRTFVMDEHDVLTRTNRNSVPDGTPVYETIAYITQKILDVFHARLNEHTDFVNKYRTLPTHNPHVVQHYNKYTEMLQGWIQYLEEESVKQGGLLAEPGGPAYEEARARAYGKNIGTREEQLARNTAANEAVRASLRPGNSEHGVLGGSRKRGRKIRRQTRRLN
jgi:hypothetical protein